ncbi:MAG: DUF2971 domain-containing protein [Ferrovibrio sp.]|uniref:DUF2971 domain-containing protein n=1 Tax=Ferrovibrio sp. TaxID=1917215 RepID=UPI00260C1E3F|nr:DUF2971 domain-containing protein [Ferrovibrio sp.]MCW0235483.1 DUF2971 domain-containing protein [Ferrovibrio sp.]
MSEIGDQVPTIFHYCSAAAFKSIIESKSLWLTDLHQTNDAREGREVTEAVVDLLREMKVEEYQIKRWRETYDSSYDLCQGYGFCLSEDGDLLSQWRGYADDGHGFAIGFNGNLLRDIAKKRTSSAEGFPLYSLQQVEYERHIQKNSLKNEAEVIRNCVTDGALNHHRIPSLLSFESDEETKIKQEKAWHTLSMVHFVLSYIRRFGIKHSSFKEEKEWRLFAAHLNTDSGFSEAVTGVLNFLPRRHSLVPYLKFEIDPEALFTKIVLGPRNRIPSMALKSFLRKNRLLNIQVDKSVAPYL